MVSLRETIMVGDNQALCACMVSQRETIMVHDDLYKDRRFTTFKRTVLFKVDELPSTFSKDTVVILTKDYTDSNGFDSDGLKKDQLFIINECGCYKHIETLTVENVEIELLDDQTEWCEIDLGDEEELCAYVKAKDLRLTVLEDYLDDD